MTRNSSNKHLAVISLLHLDAYVVGFDAWASLSRQNKRLTPVSGGPRTCNAPEQILKLESERSFHSSYLGVLIFAVQGGVFRLRVPVSFRLNK